MSGRPKAVGIDIFGGGFTAGVLEYFDVVCHLEEGEIWTEQTRANFPDLPIYVGVDKWPIAALREQNIELVYANPPCAPFSAAGKTMIYGRDSWKTDSRVDMTRRALEAAAAINPTTIVLESVCRAWTIGAELYIGYAKFLRELDYTCQVHMSDAMLAGLPQRRRRFYFVASKIDITFKLEFPETPPRPIDAIGHLVDMPTVWPINPDWLAAEASHPAPGDIRRSYMEAFPERNYGKPPFMVHRAPWFRPGGSMMSMICQLHPLRNRFYQPEETKLLCGYDPDWKLVGTLSYQQAALTQAVTPIAGKYIAKNVARSMDRGDEPLRDPKLLLYLTDHIPFANRYYNTVYPAAAPGTSMSDADYREPKEGFGPNGKAIGK